MRILGSFSEAEDATQEVYVKIYKRIQDFRGEASLWTWIYRIAVNTCLDKAKSKNFKRDEIDIHSVRDLMIAQDNKMQTDYDNSILEKEIQKLPERCKVVFVLFAIEGFKHEEIASILQISEGTSKSQYFNAKKILRKGLLPYKKELLNAM